jgi:hypothetical protein
VHQRAAVEQRLWRTAEVRDESSREAIRLAFMRARRVHPSTSHETALFLFTNLSRHSSRIALIARRHASL